SRRFALFRDVSRPVRGLRTSGCVTPVTACVEEAVRPDECWCSRRQPFQLGNWPFWPVE
ncbi:uncharacterized protein METZ01_LOCUS128916, partial [marine metagenome]